MEITEVRIKLTEDPGERLQAFCSVTLDHCFVVRDLKIIDGANGPFVAMPSRKLTAHCPGCGYKNHLRAAYCNQCGKKLSERTVREEDGRAKLYADIAHPINSTCREMIQQAIIAAYREEVDRSKQPGYRSNYDDLDRDLEAVVEPAAATCNAKTGDAATHNVTVAEAGPFGADATGSATSPPTGPPEPATANVSPLGPGPMHPASTNPAPASPASANPAAMNPVSTNSASAESGAEGGPAASVVPPPKSAALVPAKPSPAPTSGEGPRGPHRAPTRPPTGRAASPGPSTSTTSAGAADDDFGAGIF